MRRPSALGSETRLHEPVVQAEQAEQVHRDQVEQFGLGHERVANEREHSTAKNAQRSTVAYCARRPNTRGPVSGGRDAVRGPSAFSVAGLSHL